MIHNKDLTFTSHSWEHNFGQNVLHKQNWFHPSNGQTKHTYNTTDDLVPYNYRNDNSNKLAHKTHQQ